ncbi:uncharacterized protein JCM15063_005864 [Sporobolomyces koalae]|uniref:uncharacterized protein n=1 Tax=Sporobolomyces koalae TaxID=500713 RepID=UPI003180F20B
MNPRSLANLKRGGQHGIVCRAPEAPAASTSRAAERTPGAQRTRAKNGEGARGKKEREALDKLVREKDKAKAKVGYSRELRNLEKSFLKTTKQYGAEGILLIGHPQVVHRKSKLRPADELKSTSDGASFKHWVSAGLTKDSKREIDPTDLLKIKPKSNGSMDFRQARQIILAAFNAMFGEMLDGFVKGMREEQNKQQRENERRMAADARELQREFMRKYRPDMTSEEIEAAIARHESARKKPAANYIDTDDSEDNENDSGRGNEDHQDKEGDGNSDDALANHN